MTPERWNRVIEIFHDAVERPPSRAEEFLRDRCGEDTELYAEIRAMLEQHSRSGVLDRPVRVPSETAVFSAGQIIAGRYRIVRSLGRGGMGEVYEAEDLELKGRVALKTLLLAIAGDERMVDRFKQEIQLARKISHPNVCRVFDLARHPADGSSPETIVFLTMELVEGETLAARLQREGRSAPDTALPILKQIAEALDAAHRAGVIHRDLKPSNVMLAPASEGPRAVVTDFGLARSFVPTGETTATLSGHIVGTLDYMAPELLTGGAATVASDIYALGMMAYKMVTGSLPFAAETPLAAAILRSKVPVPTPRSVVPALDPGWDRAIIRALDADPTRRFSNAAEFVKALRGEAPSMTVTLPAMTRRRVVAGVAVLLLLIALGVSWQLWTRSHNRPPAEALRWYQTGSVALRDNTYYRAVRALERAVALDPDFALAHARLAEAWNEIDDSGRAKSEMLRALSKRPGHAASPETDPLYVDAINRTLIGDFPGAIRAYTQLVARLSESEKAQVLVDLGRARERNDEVPKALEAYRQAAQLDPQNAAAHLRAAILLGGRQLKLADAAAEFGRAESLYEALGNTEGQVEVQYQRGYLASVVRKLPEARAALEKAIQLSRAISTQHQEIASVLQLSAVTYQEGDAAQSQQIARNAVERAQHAGMENLAARGLSNLGFTQVGKGDYGSAEVTFREAFELSQTQQMPRNEARARFGLAGLHQLQGAAAAALSEIAPALNFYHKAGFRLEEVQCLTVIARANRDLGHYAESLAAFERQISAVQAADDRQQMALAEAGMASVLFFQEHWPDALSHYERYYELAKSIADRDGVGRALVSRANILWRLGRYQEAERVLAEADDVATQGGNSGPLVALIAISRSTMALSLGRLREAESQARKTLRMESILPKDRATVEWVAALALARAGSTTDAKRLGAESIEAFSKLQSNFDLAEARLAMSEILLANSEPKKARDEAESVIQVVEATGHNETAWRAWSLLGRAHSRLGEMDRAMLDYSRASSRLAALQQTWHSSSFDTYLKRPDIRGLRSGVKE
jgi:eukaryotic-like serine/threonine-protein kinase